MHRVDKKTEKYNKFSHCKMTVNDGVDVSTEAGTIEHLSRGTYSVSKAPGEDTYYIDTNHDTLEVSELELDMLKSRGAIDISMGESKQKDEKPLQEDHADMEYLDDLEDEGVTVIVNMTYSTVTSESAEYGDFADSGFIYEGKEFEPEDLYKAMENDGFIHPSTYPIPDGEPLKYTWISTEPRIEDYSSDETIEYSLHFDTTSRQHPRAAELWEYLLRIMSY